MDVYKTLFLGACFCFLGPVGAQSQDSLTSNTHYEVGLSYKYQYFKNPTKSHWHQGTLMGKIGLEHITFVPQLMYELRRNEGLSSSAPQGLQYLLDVYPVLGKRTYLTLSYAYSGAPVFARHRGHIEAHVNIGQAWELSAGAQYLYYNQHLFTYTASLGKYIGAYWLILRGGVTQQVGTYSLQPTINLGVRRFFKDATDYMHWSMFYGLSQDDITAIGAQSVSDMLSGIGTYFTIRKSVSLHWALAATLAYRYEDYKQDRSRHVMGVDVGLIYKF